ncbi:MAG: hypothetical protein IJX90_07060 [Blautia sp.]|nr:hypothetical protein [Blautia sp.]
MLTHENSSLAPPGASLVFILDDDEGFRWLGEYEISSDEMLSGTEKKKGTKIQEAKDMICAILVGGKQAFSEKIDRNNSSYGSSTSYGSSNNSSYDSSNSSSGYGYDKNDPYYSANDHDGDGKINDQEFQDAMNDAINDLLAQYGE